MNYPSFHDLVDAARLGTLFKSWMPSFFQRSAPGPGPQLVAVVGIAQALFECGFQTIKSTKFHVEHLPPVTAALNDSLMRLQDLQAKLPSV